MPATVLLIAAFFFGGGLETVDYKSTYTGYINWQAAIDKVARKWRSEIRLSDTFVIETLQVQQGLHKVGIKSDAQKLLL